MKKEYLAILLSIFLILNACNPSFDRKNPDKEQDKVGKTFYTIFKKHDLEEFKKYIFEFEEESKKNQLLSGFNNFNKEVGSYKFGNSKFDWNDTEYLYTEVKKREYLDPTITNIFTQGVKKINSLEFKVYFKNKNEPRVKIYFIIEMSKVRDEYVILPDFFGTNLKPVFVN
jgi:hypothetical protein